MDQLALNELNEKFPDLGQVVCVQSEVWKELLGEETVRSQPEIPIFLRPDDLAGLHEKRGLEHGRLAASVERFLSDERVFADASATVCSVKAMYRRLLAGYCEDLPARLDARLRASAEQPKEQVAAAVLALNLWSEDPRKDAAAWFLWLMIGSAMLRMRETLRAQEYLAKAVELNAASAEAYDELGLCFALKQDYEQAEASFKQALTIAPEDFGALSRLGAVCLQRGRRAEALAYLRRAREQRPADQKVNDLLRTAEAMKE